MTDIITGIIDIVQEQIAAVTPEIARVIERRARSRWGGEQTYIAKTCDVIESKKQTINNELQAGHSIAQIEQLHGIPRSTIYRLINHKGVKPWRD
jgi:Mor family transcriptional regulator